MFSFVQSLFLQSLGHAIAGSLWQMALIWLLYLVLNTIFRFTATARYRVAVVAQLAGFCWFIGTLLMQYYSATPANPGLDYMQPVSFLLAKASPFLPWISLVYLLLISVMAVKWVTGYAHTQMMRKQGLEKMPVNWRLFTKKISAQLGLRKNMGVFLSKKITTPLTIGFLKPIILLPLATINHLSTAQLEAVLLHEMAHIKRHDYLVNLFISVMELALFFNPFSQLISNYIHKERENSCDDWVLQFQYNATEYAEGLLRLAHLQMAPGFAMAASGKKTELLSRVKRMLGQPEKGYGNAKRLLALVIVTGMLACIALVSPTDTTIVAHASAQLSQVNKLHPTPKNVKKRIEHPVLAKMRQARKVLKENNGSIKVPAPGEQDMDKVLATIKNIDLENLMTAIFNSADLTDDDKKQLGNIKEIFLSERNRDLLKKEFKEKESLRRLYTNTVNGQNDDVQVQQEAAPVTINVSFRTRTPEPDDEHQVARIKLAILKQLNEILLHKETKGITHL